MKFGYSMLLSEHINAERLNYEDCKCFQVVCPACREPIFKVTREPGPLHYLSHYAAEAAYVADCELRVGHMDREQVAREDGLARNQRLALFLRVLQSAITRRELTPATAHKMAVLQKLMNRSKAAGFLRDVMVGHLLSANDFESAARHYIYEDVGQDSSMWRTGFALETQIRIAGDIYRHLHGRPARKSYDFLWNYSYSFLEDRLIRGIQAGIATPDSRLLLSYVSRLINSSKKGGGALMAEMAEMRLNPPFVLEPGTTMLTKLCAEVAHEMIGCLLRLPYFEILRDAQRREAADAAP